MKDEELLKHLYEINDRQLFSEDENDGLVFVKLLTFFRIK